MILQTFAHTSSLISSTSSLTLILTTILTGIFVLLGIALTGWLNRRRLRHELIERRANETCRALQRRYSQFAAVGLRILSNAVGRGGYSELIKDVVGKIKLETFQAALANNFGQTPRTVNPALYEMYEDFDQKLMEHVDAIVRDVLKLSAARASIMLLDDSEDRLGELHQLYLRLTSLPRQPPVEWVRAVEVDLNNFILRVSDQLEDKYQYEHDLAAKGMYPARVRSVDRSKFAMLHTAASHRPAQGVPAEVSSADSRS